jgi:ABC-type nitrate/sulfonate/bicarbonate transport system ATPase subunit
VAKSADHVQTAHPDKVGGFAFGSMVTFNRTDEKDADAAFGAQSSQSAVYAIETAHVSKMMERDSRPLQVLRDVNFHAEEGEFVSIIGPSGCGKSTLLNIIAGLDSPTSGSVALHGGTDRLRLGSVGYMQQKDLLMPWRSVLDNATLGLELQGVSKRDAGQRARQHLGRFGLEGFENAYPHELSGGMRQRAAFLRTVLADQEVFLLDEPFGALDALNRTQIHQWLTSLWESLQKTIVLVTHDVDEAILLSDRVYVMSARPGRMKMVQSVDLSRPRSIDVFSTPAFMALKSALLNSIREEAPEESYL